MIGGSIFFILAVFFFFFQAEDGIRDDLVTGVQTCALPICILSYTHAQKTQHDTNLLHT